MKFSWSIFAIKITSRKFWLAIAGLVTAIMAFFNCDSNEIVQVTAIISALGSVIGYLIANGLTDDSTVMPVSKIDNKDTADES